MPSSFLQQTKGELQRRRKSRVLRTERRPAIRIPSSQRSSSQPCVDTVQVWALDRVGVIPKRYRSRRRQGPNPISAPACCQLALASSPLHAMQSRIWHRFAGSVIRRQIEVLLLELPAGKHVETHSSRPPARQYAHEQEPFRRRRKSNRRVAVRLPHHGQPGFVN